MINFCSSPIKQPHSPNLSNQETKGAVQKTAGWTNNKEMWEVYFSNSSPLISKGLRCPRGRTAHRWHSVHSACSRSQIKYIASLQLKGSSSICWEKVVSKTRSRKTTIRLLWMYRRWIHMFLSYFNTDKFMKLPQNLVCAPAHDSLSSIELFASKANEVSGSENRWDKFLKCLWSMHDCFF